MVSFWSCFSISKGIVRIFLGVVNYGNISCEIYAINAALLFSESFNNH